MTQQEMMSMQGQIRYPYTWAIGKAAARFISELVNSKRIVGAKCPSCSKTLVPPYDVCGECFVELDQSNFVEVGPCGTVQTYTVVHHANPWSPVEAPYALISVRLDGADTDLVHILKDPDDRLKIGARVEPVFDGEAPAGMLSIGSFQLTDAPMDGSRPTPITEFEAKPIYEIKGRVEVPYTWDYGEMASRFFQETRDNKKIMGSKCPKCKGVLIPPVGMCGACFVATEEEWVEISDHGILISWTVVHLPFPGQPTEPPYCYGLIKLDGCNTQYPHIIKGAREKNWDDLEVGMRVEAVWNEERIGDLYDIAYFKREGT